MLYKLLETNRRRYSLTLGINENKNLKQLPARVSLTQDELACFVKADVLYTYIYIYIHLYIYFIALLSLLTMAK